MQHVHALPAEYLASSNVAVYKLGSL